MDLSIIIVSWNTRDLLAGCLNAIRAELEGSEFAAGDLDAEVFVVDNASEDGSTAMLRKDFPWVRCITNLENVGFAAANNRGLRRASGDFLLLLNSDTIVQPGALPALLAFMRAPPDAGAAGARLLYRDGSLQTSCYPEPTLLREAWRMFHLDALCPYGVYDTGTWDLEAPREVDNILGACMLLRRETFDQVGEMDESYFMYSEEIDWCLRIRQAGWKIYWVPEAQVVHLVGQSTRQQPIEMFLFLYRGKIRYFRKHAGRPAAVAYKLILLGASITRLALSPLALFRKPVDRNASWNLAGNYARLLVRLPGY